MKNEAKNIDACLNAIKDYGFEIVIVDTGSSDDSVSIAQKYTDSIYSFEWVNDFSAARNFSLSKATNDWILVLDCDEIVTQLDIDRLLELTKLPEQCLCTISRRNHFESNGTDSVYTDTVHRFFNRNATHYEGSIHEQPYPIRSYPIPPCGIEHSTGIICEHSGYSGTEDEYKEKCSRNEILLLEELKNDPNNPYTYFQLGQCYNRFDDEKALFYYSKGLEFDVNPDLEYVQMMVIAYGYALIHLERFEEALGLLSIYDEFATSSDFICMIGIAYMRSGQYIKALGEFLKAINHPVAHNEGSNSYIPLYNMGIINEMLGEKEAAILYYQKCGSFKPAVDRLNELFG